jgi:hypothetical protein
MKKLVALAAAFTLVAALPAGAAAQDPPKPKPEPKPEQKAEATAKPSYAGKWTMSLQSPNGSFAATVEIALDEKEPSKVKGSITSELGTSPVYGEIEDGTLWFAVNREGTELWFKGTLQEDGTMAGALDIQGNLLPFTATRVKEK